MSQQHPQRRRGGLMICVLACLAIVVSLVMWIARDAVAARRETRIRLQLQQTDRLLDAGIMRATKQRRADENYQVETWKPKLQIRGHDVRASVEIQIEDDRVRVVAQIGQQPHSTTKSYLYSLSEIQ